MLPPFSSYWGLDMASSKKFFTDGMTVDEILSLPADVLNSLSARDMSRALRTVALAANKRVDKLLKNAVKRKTGTYDKNTGKPLYEYREKKSGKAIATDALNYITNDGRNSPKFSVGDKNRNEMYKELARVKDFMRLETSTIKGAVAVRKAREARILGQTREQYAAKQVRAYKRDYEKKTGRKPSKRNIEKVRKAAMNEHVSMSSLAWHYFRTFLESEGLPNNLYHHFDESETVIGLIGSRTAAGQSEAEIHQAAHEYLQRRYEAAQDELLEEFAEMGGSDGLIIDY